MSFAITRLRIHFERQLRGRRTDSEALIQEPDFVRLPVTSGMPQWLAASLREDHTASDIEVSPKWAIYMSSFNGPVVQTFSGLSAVPPGRPRFDARRAKKNEQDDPAWNTQCRVLFLSLDLRGAQAFLPARDVL
jgi:hypothetical protein